MIVEKGMKYKVREGSRYIESYGLLEGHPYICEGDDVMRLPPEQSQDLGWTSSEYGYPLGTHRYLYLDGDQFEPYKIIIVGGE